MGLLQAIEKYLRTNRMCQSRFGRLAVNDPRLIHDLRRGRQLRPATLARVERFLRDDGART